MSPLEVFKKRSSNNSINANYELLETEFINHQNLSALMPHKFDFFVISIMINALQQ